MRMWTLRLCALLALAQCPPAQSRVQLGPDDPVQIDPSIAYIFFRTRMPGANIRFLRELAPGESARTDDPMPEPDRWIQVDGRKPRFSKGREGDGYLRGVRPGSYILYGNIGVGLNGAQIGICHCMGSLRFEAPPGKIVDLGEIVWPKFKAETRPWGVTVLPFAPTMAVPARLAGFPRVAASFSAAPKMPNYFGVEIDRHDPMPGVLAYRRDIPIDVRTGRPAEPVR